jgi:hypothetical protein
MSQPPANSRRRELVEVREQGTVKCFNASKSFGFLQRQTGEDVFSTLLGDPDGWIQIAQRRSDSGICSKERSQRPSGREPYRPLAGAFWCT